MLTLPEQSDLVRCHCERCFSKTSPDAEMDMAQTRQSCLQVSYPLLCVPSFWLQNVNSMCMIIEMNLCSNPCHHHQAAGSHRTKIVTYVFLAGQLN